MRTCGGPNIVKHMHSNNSIYPPRLMVKKLDKVGLNFKTEGFWNLGPFTPYNKFRDSCRLEGVYMWTSATTIPDLSFAWDHQSFREAYLGFECFLGEFFNLLPTCKKNLAMVIRIIGLFHTDL